MKKAFYCTFVAMFMALSMAGLTAPSAEAKVKVYIGGGYYDGWGYYRPYHGYYYGYCDYRVKTVRVWSNEYHKYIWVKKRVRYCW